MIFPAVRLSVFILLATSGARAAVDPAKLDAANTLYRTTGKSLEAQKAYEAIVAEDPTNASAHLRLGLLALRRDDTDAAIPLLEKAAQLAPTHSETHRNLGDAYGRAAQKKGIFGGLGLGKKCLAMYQKAAELDPNNVDAHGSLFDFYRQAPGIAGGSNEKALAEAAAIKKLDPPRGRIAFATFYVSEKKYDQALAEFDGALKNDPDDYNSLYQIGRLAAITGQFVDRGLASLRRCLELTPPTPNTPSHAAAQWRLGQLLEKKNDRAGARAAYEAAVKLDANFTPPAEALKKLK
jgi:tetratricopeptide (TPR) repeat protein